MISIKNKAVADVFESYPEPIQKKLFEIRALIFRTAELLPEVGRIEETLKWGEPAYLTSESKSGTTIRLAWKTKMPDQYAVYVHCQTNLIETYRDIFPETVNFDGTRGIIFTLPNEIPVNELKLFIKAALTYHLLNHK